MSLLSINIAPDPSVVNKESGVPSASISIPPAEEVITIADSSVPCVLMISIVSVVPIFVVKLIA